MAVDASGPQFHHEERPVSPGGFVNIVGASLSLALVIGVSVWAYKTITRDVSGVPVMDARSGSVSANRSPPLAKWRPTVCSPAGVHDPLSNTSSPMSSAGDPVTERS